MKGMASIVGSANIIGTTTNDSAAAGRIGEFITATVATPGTSLSNGVAANITSISLTAGDWDVSSFVDFLRTGATGTSISCGPSLTTATLPTQAGGAGLGTDALAQSDAVFTALSGTVQIDSGPIRVSLAATTTVFLVTSSAFSGGTVSAYGTIRARRIR